MVSLLKRLLDEGINPAMAEQILALEIIFTLKIKTLLTQMMLSMANCQTTHIDGTYYRFQQRNVKLQIEVQDGTKELCSTVAVRISSILTPASMVTPVKTIPDPRVAAAAADWKTPRLYEQARQN